VKASRRSLKRICQAMKSRRSKRSKRASRREPGLGRQKRQKRRLNQGISSGDAKASRGKHDEEGMRLRKEEKRPGEGSVEEEDEIREEPEGKKEIA